MMSFIWIFLINVKSHVTSFPLVALYCLMFIYVFVRAHNPIPPDNNSINYLLFVPIRIRFIEFRHRKLIDTRVDVSTQLANRVYVDVSKRNSDDNNFSALLVYLTAYMCIQCEAALWIARITVSVCCICK